LFRQCQQAVACDLTYVAVLHADRQDTNGLAFHTLPLMLGVSKELGLIMNSLAVPRKAKQAIGGISKLKKKDNPAEEK